MFSFVWLLFVTKVISPNVIEIWEALLTLLFFVFIYFNRKFIQYFVNDSKHFINLDRSLSVDSLQLKSTLADDSFCENIFDQNQNAKILRKKICWLFKVSFTF
jgi:hypothetical protein